MLAHGFFLVFVRQESRYVSNIKKQVKSKKVISTCYLNIQTQA